MRPLGLSLLAEATFLWKMFSSDPVSRFYSIFIISELKRSYSVQFNKQKHSRYRLASMAVALNPPRPEPLALLWEGFCMCCGKRHLQDCSVLQDDPLQGTRTWMCPLPSGNSQAAFRLKPCFGCPLHASPCSLFSWALWMLFSCSKNSSLCIAQRCFLPAFHAYCPVPFTLAKTSHDQLGCFALIRASENRGFIDQSLVMLILQNISYCYTHFEMFLLSEGSEGPGLWVRGEEQQWGHVCVCCVMVFYSSLVPIFRPTAHFCTHM